MTSFYKLWLFGVPIDLIVFSYIGYKRLISSLSLVQSSREQGFGCLVSASMLMLGKTATQEVRRLKE